MAHLLEVLPHSPDLSKYVPLSEHQSSTPASFSVPVLHFHSSNNQIVITSDLLAVPGPLQAVFGPPPASTASSTVPSEIQFDDVVIIAGSDAFLISPRSTSKTLVIPYPLITLHALQHAPSLSSPQMKLYKIYLQVSPPSASSDTFEDNLMELVVIPRLPVTPIPSSSDAMMLDQSAQAAINGNTVQYNQETLTKAVFDALTRCADLHPTHSSAAQGFFDEPDDEDDGTDDEQEDQIAFEGTIGYGDDAMDIESFSIPKFGGPPGDGGWITSENVHLLDNGGHVRISGGLGPGAGSVRPRLDDEDDDRPDGHEHETMENKWRRTG